MKKIIALSLALVTLAGIAFGGLSVINRGSFSGTGTPASAVEIVVPAQNGIINNTALCLSVETNATVTVRRPQVETTAQAATANTTLVIYTDSSNVVDGVTLTTDDYLLVRNAASGYQLRKISATGVYASGYTSYTVAANVTAAAGDPVYVCDAGDDLSISGIAANDQTGLRYMFTSFRRKPVVLSVPASAGDVVLSGTYSVEE